MTCWRHGVMSSFAPACFVLKQIVTHERALHHSPSTVVSSCEPPNTSNETCTYFFLLVDPQRPADLHRTGSSGKIPWLPSNHPRILCQCGLLPYTVQATNQQMMQEGWL